MTSHIITSVTETQCIPDLTIHRKAHGPFVLHKIVFDGHGLDSLAWSAAHETLWETIPTCFVNAANLGWRCVSAQPLHMMSSEHVVLQAVFANAVRCSVSVMVDPSLGDGRGALPPEAIYTKLVTQEVFGACLQWLSGLPLASDRPASEWDEVVSVPDCHVWSIALASVGRVIEPMDFLSSGELAMRDL